MPNRGTKGRKEGRGEERERRKRERKNEGGGKERREGIKRVSEVWKRQRHGVYREEKQHTNKFKDVEARGNRFA